MTEIEKEYFLRLFIRDGYVLDFGTNDFDDITRSSIGISLCQHYGLSKGASLTAYCKEADENSLVKLFSDLLGHYEAFCKDKLSEVYNTGVYEKCKEIIKQESNYIHLEAPAITAVNREYIAEMAIRANRDVEIGEYDSAITKARTLLEETFCHAIEVKGETPTNSGEIGKLYNQFKTL